MSKKIFLLLTICLLILAVIYLKNDSAEKIRIFLIGDSTMANKPLADNPERGLGTDAPSIF